MAYVRRIYFSAQDTSDLLVLCLFQQMQLLSVGPILVLVLVQSTWTMLAALAVKTTSLTALEALSAVHMATQRMQEYDVKVWRIMLYFSET